MDTAEASLIGLPSARRSRNLPSPAIVPIGRSPSLTMRARCNRPFLTGEGPLRIYRTARLLHDVFVAAADLASPRLSALWIAAGPRRKHKFVTDMWAEAFTAIIGESLATVVAEVEGTPAGALAKCGRPAAPFLLEEDLLMPPPTSSEVRARRTFRPGVEISTPLGFPIAIVLDPYLGACSARSRAITLTREFTSFASTPANERPESWHGQVLNTLAHETAHVWQAAESKPCKSLSGSFGGSVEDHSPHAARPGEPYANACGYAAEAAEMGWTYAEFKDRFVQSITGCGYEADLFDLWRRPAFVEAYPVEAYAARVFDRFFRRFVPVFAEERRRLIELPAADSPSKAAPWRRWRLRTPAPVAPPREPETPTSQP